MKLNRAAQLVRGYYTIRSMPSQAKTASWSKKGFLARSQC